MRVGAARLLLLQRCVQCSRAVAPTTSRLTRAFVSRRLSQWGNLGTQADGRKENTQAAAAWNTARVPQSRAALRPAAAFVLDVYEDEDFSDAAPAPAPAPASHVPLRKRLEDEVSCWRIFSELALPSCMR
jgi:hypothetical protein